MTPEESRALYPEFAEFVDGMKKVFGPVKVKFLEGRGHSQGTPSDHEHYLTADQFLKPWPETPLQIKERKKGSKR